MIDKTMEYIPFCMIRKSGAKLPEAPIHEEFHLRYYKDGDEENWAEIMKQVNEFDSKKAAFDYFMKDFMPYKEKLYTRMMYLCKGDETIGTITAWHGDIIMGIEMPCLHWVAIIPEYQGFRLGKSIVIHGVKRMIELDGDVDLYLSTQAWSYKAVGIYKWAGFEIYKGKLKDRENQYKKAIPILEKMKRQ